MKIQLINEPKYTGRDALKQVLLNRGIKEDQLLHYMYTNVTDINSYNKLD